MDKKKNLIKCLRLWSAILCVKAELDQLCTGLKTMGVLDIMKTHSKQMKRYFCWGKEKLTAGIALKFCVIALEALF